MFYNNMYYISTKINNKNNNSLKTVLFLHGWGGSTNSFLFLQNYLKDFYNTINIDFYGFGKSGVPIKELDTYTYALSIYEFLVSKNIKKVIIIGHSFGGRVGIILSSIFDIEVEYLILINSAGLKPRRGFLYYFKIYLYKFFKMLSNKKLFPKKILSLFGSKDYKEMNIMMKKNFINIVNQDLKFLLKYIKCNTTIVWGDKDKSTPISMAKIMNKNILKSELVVFKGCGHFSYLEDKGKFLRVIDKVLF